MSIRFCPDVRLRIDAAVAAKIVPCFGVRGAPAQTVLANAHAGAGV